MSKVKEYGTHGLFDVDLQRLDFFRWLKAESFLKNEATELIDNKGSALGELRNEATV